MHDIKLYIQEAEKLCDQDRADEAWGIAEYTMDLFPSSGAALMLASLVAWKMRKFPLAYQLAVRATQLGPIMPLSWLRLGISAHEIWLVDEAESAFKTGARLARTKEELSAMELGLSALLFDTGRYGEAEVHAKKALELNPQSEKAKANLGLSRLGQRKWEGWDLYTHALGLPGRRRMRYGKEEPWDGAKGKVVAFYGEQGIGDELSFASMLPDAVKDCERVILDCDAKLEHLFRRSFPGVKVYGTRWEKVLDWDTQDRAPDASLALGELGKFYRRTDESFPGTPFLVADPIRRQMWRSEFDKKKKPVIGIAWTGGLPWTGQKFRTLTLDHLKPVMQSIDAHWVSLQYKDASKEIAEFRKANPGIDLVQYPWATLTEDYDDTAALVAEVDMVVSMQTAVVHLAGALGKECLVLLPKHSQWRYSDKGETTPWYGSVRLLRQRSLQDWHGPIGEVIGRLRKRYAQAEAA